MNTRPVIVNNEKPEIIGDYYMSKKHVEIGGLTLPIIDIDNNQGKYLSPVPYPDRPARIMALKPDVNAPKIHCIDINATPNNTDDVTWNLIGVIQGIIVYKFKFYRDSVIVIGAEMPEMFNAPGFIAVFRPESKDDNRVLYKGFWGNIDVEEILSDKEKFMIDGVDYTACNSSFICCGTNMRFADEYRIRRKSMLIIADRGGDDVYGSAKKHFTNMSTENIVKVIKIKNPDNRKSVLAAIDEIMDYRFLVTNPLSAYIFGFSHGITQMIRDALVEADKKIFSYIDYPNGSYILFSKDVLPEKPVKKVDAKKTADEETAAATQESQKEDEPEQPVNTDVADCDAEQDHAESSKEDEPEQQSEEE